MVVEAAAAARQMSIFKQRYILLKALEFHLNKMKNKWHVHSPLINQIMREMKKKKHEEQQQNTVQIFEQWIQNATKYKS